MVSVIADLFLIFEGSASNNYYMTDEECQPPPMIYRPFYAIVT